MHQVLGKDSKSLCFDSSHFFKPICTKLFFTCSTKLLAIHCLHFAPYLSEVLNYSALPFEARYPGMNQWRNPLIHGALRGRVPLSSELKNSGEGIFQQFPFGVD